MKAVAALIVTVLASIVLYAEDAPDRFVGKVKLSPTLTAVVAEGDLEGRSLGSFSVRLYSSENAQPGDDTTFFVAGVIRERNGSIEKVMLADVGGTGRPEIVVIVRNAGTGQYLSGHAFAFDEKSVVLRAAVDWLAKDADVVAALKKSMAPTK